MIRMHFSMEDNDFMDQLLVKMNGGYGLEFHLMLILVELYKTFTNN
ncbi:hypothetical protein BCJMU51_4236 [Bacillus cereus]|nr:MULTISPECIES: hypothetical protein [Bacillus]MBL3852666.1 hypothetical protein [Bacillus cereus]MCC0758657.1 hypothetical protein [Bacillus sp. BRTN]MCC0770714.1 hypothetical protein [Bacillus pacificus]MCU5322668.1 hypothetical protein [Bacillus cereus]MCU5715889.1 hypothetical protein [Bacillus cereus]